MSYYGGSGGGGSYFSSRPRSSSKRKRKRDKGFLGDFGTFWVNLGRDIADTAKGLYPGLKTMFTDPGKAIDSIVESYTYLYAPLFKGEFKTFGQRVYEHPLGPLLDLASIVTFGSTGAVKAASGLAKAGEKVGVSSSTLNKIAKSGSLENRLYSLRSPAARGGKTRKGETTIPSLSGHTAEILLSKNPVRRQQQKLYHKTLNLLPGNFPVLGEYSRYGRAIRYHKIVKKLRLEDKVRDFTFAVRRLNSEEKAALWFLANAISPNDYRRFLRENLEAGQPVEPDIIKALSNPNIQRLYDNPTNNMKKAYVEGQRIADLDAQLLGPSGLNVVDPEELYERPFIAARILSGARWLSAEAAKRRIGSISRALERIERKRARHVEKAIKIDTKPLRGERGAQRRLESIERRGQKLQKQIDKLEMEIVDVGDSRFLKNSIYESQRRRAQMERLRSGDLSDVDPDDLARLYGFDDIESMRIAILGKAVDKQPELASTIEKGRAGALRVAERGKKDPTHYRAMVEYISENIDAAQAEILNALRYFEGVLAADKKAKRLTPDELDAEYKRVVGGRDNKNPMKGEGWRGKAIRAGAYHIDAVAPRVAFIDKLLEDLSTLEDFAYSRPWADLDVSDLRKLKPSERRNLDQNTVAEIVKTIREVNKAMSGYRKQLMASAKPPKGTKRAEKAVESAERAYLQNLKNNYVIERLSAPSDKFRGVTPDMLEDYLGKPLSHRAIEEAYRLFHDEAKKHALLEKSLALKLAQIEVRRKQAGLAAKAAESAEEVQRFQEMRINLLKQESEILHELLTERERFFRERETLLRIVEENGRFVGGKSIAEIREQLINENRADPFYMPHQSVVAYKRYRGGTSEPVSPVFPIKGTNLMLGRIALDPEVLSAEYIRDVSYAYALDLWDGLKAAAVRIPWGEDPPKGWVYVKRSGSERIGHYVKNRGEIREDLERLFDDVSTQDVEEALTDIVDGERYRLAVPERLVKQLVGEWRGSSNAFIKIWRNFTDVWRALVLNYRPAFLVNNVIGNHLLYSLQFSGLAGIRAYIEASRIVMGDSYVVRRLSRSAVPRNAKMAMIREFFPDQVHGTFGETQKDVRGLAKRLEKPSAGVVPLTMALAERVPRTAIIIHELRKHPMVKKRIKEMPKETRDFWEAAEDLLSDFKTPEMEALEKEISLLKEEWFSPEGFDVEGLEEFGSDYIQRALRRRERGEDYPRKLTLAFDPDDLDELIAHRKRIEERIAEKEAKLISLIEERRSISQRLRDDIATRANEALGDYLNMGQFERVAIRGMFPFYAWYRAIWLIALRLPFEHPLKTAIISRLSQIAIEETRARYGELPPFLEGSIPLSDEEFEKITLGFIGRKHGRQPFLYTGGVNPFETPLQIAAGLGSLVTSPPKEGILGAAEALSLANPFIQALTEQVSGRKLLTGAPAEQYPGGVIGGTVLAPLFNLPEVSLIKSAIRDETTPRTLYDKDWQRLLSNFLGLPIRQVNLEAARRLARAQQENR